MTSDDLRARVRALADWLRAEEHDRLQAGTQIGAGEASGLGIAESRLRALLDDPAQPAAPRGDVEALAEVGDLAAVIATPNERGTVYVAHAQIREALARHILASDWLAAHDAEVLAGRDAEWRKRLADVYALERAKGRAEVVARVEGVLMKNITDTGGVWHAVTATQLRAALTDEAIR